MTRENEEKIKGIHKLQGFVISSWAGIDRITDPPHSNYSHSVQAGILAGIDIVSCYTFLKPNFIKHLVTILVILMSNVDFLTILGYPAR